MPAAGYRRHQLGGQISEQEVRGHYWGSTVYSDRRGPLLSFTAGASTPNFQHTGTANAHATPIRCVRSKSMYGKFFLPAVGYRHPGDGTLDQQGFLGMQWSSTQVIGTSSRGYGLTFTSGSSNPSASDNKLDGKPVRCVR